MPFGLQEATGQDIQTDDQQAKTGVFESRVFDAEVGSSWGKLSSRISGAAGGSLQIFTRSGNSEKPDNSWSDWSAAYAAGSGGHQVTSQGPATYNGKPRLRGAEKPTLAGSRLTSWTVCAFHICSRTFARMLAASMSFLSASPCNRVPHSRV